MGQYADRFKKWASRYGVEFIPEPPPPTPVRESDGLPVGSLPIHSLPTTFAEMGPQQEEEDDSTASVWAQLLCGRGDLKLPRARTAAELEARRIGTANEAFARSAAGCHIQLDARVGRADNYRAQAPTGPTQRELAAQSMRDAHARLKAQGLDLA